MTMLYLDVFIILGFLAIFGDCRGVFGGRNKSLDENFRMDAFRQSPDRFWRCIGTKSLDKFLKLAILAYRPL